MVNIVKVFILFFSLFFSNGCESLKKNKSHLDLKLFNKVYIGSSDSKNVRMNLGEPSRIDDGQWVYTSNGYPKLWVEFKNDFVDFVSIEVLEKDRFSSVEYVLKNFKGHWKTLKEPMSNPHSGPILCYLEDLKGGKRMRIHGYKKTVTSLSKWRPSKDVKSIKEYLYRNVGKEFCIAGSCSKVTDPDAWEHNHCEWLEKIVAKNKEPVINRKSKTKKSNKNNNL